MESFNMVVGKHNSLPADIKAKHEAAFAAAMVDDNVRKELDDLEEKFFHEADINKSGVLDLQ